MDLTVVPITWPQYQAAHKGHNRAKIGKGDKVYGILHSPTKQYYYYAYLNPEIAGQVIENLQLGVSAGTLTANFRDFPQVVTARTSMTPDNAFDDAEERFKELAERNKSI
jgi:hypothetical protein